ncbi:MAG: hypothetical protein MUD14_06750 [Hydrococcus sp. Prado102]|jgi:hypothetical protein|nr:hypothetical protein [Hydrococcus sp. Prado102]
MNKADIGDAYKGKNCFNVWILMIPLLVTTSSIISTITTRIKRLPNPKALLAISTIVPLAALYLPTLSNAGWGGRAQLL